MPRMASDRLYFRQLLSGLDLGQDDMIAQQMVNFVYLVGDRETGEAVAIDPAYDIDAILQVCEADGMRLTGALATHYHPDHVGGSLGGPRHRGHPRAARPHVGADPRAGRRGRVGAQGHRRRPRRSWPPTRSGDTVMVGEIPITLIHTPGHTPGSQCFLVDGKLVAGDTLFLDGCGRTDLPGGDPEQMYLSLTQRLAQVPDDAVLYPGHLYSEKPSATMAETRTRNVVFRPATQEQWLMMFGS